MKLHIEIECTPEEARRAVGLPDLTPLHDRYVGTMLDALSGSIKPDTIEQMTRNWGPMNEAGLALWRQLVEKGAGRTPG